ncbi:hypothetical protein CRV08_06645 [Halarcobacter ebronensis]|uniref:Uncharacterized protein n=2 Tax=Halarcobacter ebronensis TaxID=1462615 RepID=A0A4Q0YHU7_9BACT|nr:hypothetical protein CRV08_06645 [Halarcobacter ebronensis]
MNKLLTILLLTFIAFSFCACEDKQSNNSQSKIEEKKEVKFTPKLPIPEVREEHINKYFKLSTYFKAKHDPVPAMNIGYAYSEELHDYEKAFQWFEYANSMIPLGENSYFACYALQQLKKYDEAIKWCENAIELKWDKAISLLGTVYEDYGKYEEAVQYYKQSFEQTKDGLAANNLGYLYSTKLNDYKEAEKWYKEAIKVNHHSSYSSFSTFYHEDLHDDIKASAYAIALIDTKYTKSSVLRLLQDEWQIPNNIIKKGYELQLNSDEFPVKYDGELDLE